MGKTIYDTETNFLDRKMTNDYASLSVRNRHEMKATLFENGENGASRLSVNR